MALDSGDIVSILGYPDNLKLQSSMTLFMLVDQKQAVFSEVLDKYYNGEKDMKTVKIISNEGKEEL